MALAAPALALVEPLSPASPVAATTLWLCLYLPHLPLEAARRGAAGPMAILSEEGRQHRVRWCDEAASAAGIQPGLPVNAALALLPTLEFRHRDQAAESAALQALAAACLRLTPRVALEPDSALLLEIGASLPLFGSLDALCRLALSEAAQGGHSATLAVAPTARAALWLARAGQQRRVTSLGELPGALTELPLHATGWLRPVRQCLQRIGVQRLGGCLRLPRDGLTRRIGAATVAELDEALGRRAEIRRSWQPVERFARALELPLETTETPVLLAALAPLLAGLQAELARRQAGARLLWISFQHAGQPASLLRLGLLRPTARAAHLQELAALHLEALRLPGPVMSITLEADLAALPPVPGSDLLGWAPEPRERLAELVERLRVRLGWHAVHGLISGREPRPEQAWQAVDDPLAERVRATPVLPRPRPPWLLEEPRPLTTRAGRPWCRGPLLLESGPERIESGWWDGSDVRRDYYVASTRAGSRLWVYRDRAAGGWYLHGLFG